MNYVTRTARNWLKKYREWWVKPSCAKVYCAVHGDLSVKSMALEVLKLLNATELTYLFTTKHNSLQDV